MTTINDLITIHGVDIDPHLDRQATVPVSTGMQRQGDVIIIPTHMTERRRVATTPVPVTGVPVVRGEAGGNTHLLLADGPVRYDQVTGNPSIDNLTLGVLTVEQGAVAYLAHPEHGYAGIGSGTYVVRRQREQADQIRIVAD